LNIRPETPERTQRRNRLDTLFQFPDRSGRSRHGDTVRYRTGTASMKRRRFEETGADIREGRAANAVREPVPFRDRHGSVDACCRHFWKNIGRMRHDGYRAHGMQVGSGVVEGGCRTFGLRTERPGTRRVERGANAMPVPRGRAMNLRLPDPPGWRADQAVAA